MAFTDFNYIAILMGSRPSVAIYKLIRNSIWSLRPLIGLHVFNFSRTDAGIYSKIGTNVSKKY